MFEKSFPLLKTLRLSLAEVELVNDRVWFWDLCQGRWSNISECLPHLQGEEADDDDIYNVLSTLKRLTAYHKYAAVLLNYCAKESYFCPLGVIEC